MTKQETFDIVAKHLLDQFKKAKDPEGKCKYRIETPEGVLKCAAGCLIPDEEYDPRMEGTSIGTNLILNRAGDCIKKQGHDLDLVASLQCIHDVYAPQSWAKHLRIAAVHLELDTAVIDNHPRVKTTHNESEN